MAVTNGGNAALVAPKPFAVIFDMDGTLINNTPFHYKSWQMLFKKYGKGKLSHKAYYRDISGVPVMETVRRVFGKGRTEDELKALLNEKEEFYRRSYAPFLAPINGLLNFLAQLHQAGIKIAMATSATEADVNFILNGIPMGSYFSAIVNAAMVTRPKPDPQVFLIAASKLDTPPDRCVVFEDSLAGIKAGNNAGMKVVGITTGHKAAELSPVNLVIDDYTGLTPQKIESLFNNQDIISSASA